MKQMNYTIYKITNKINGKYYIGAHQTKNINDNYYGSGIYICRAIEKEGLDNFKKEILEYCESQEEMFRREKELIDLNGGYYPNNKMSYNLKEGGKGGWPHFEISPMRGKYMTVEQKNKVSQRTIEAMKSPDIRKKYLEANAKVDRSGKNNTMYGDNRIFVSNDELRQIRRIDKEDLNSYIQNGWTASRSKNLKYFTYEGATKGKYILVLFGVDKIPDGYYRGCDGKFVSDTKIDQQYVHPSKRKSIAIKS